VRASRDLCHTEMFGTVLENVDVDPATGAADLDSQRITETRAPRIPFTTSPITSPKAWRVIRLTFVFSDLRRVRRDAADRQADAGADDVSLSSPVTRQGRRHERGVTEPKERLSPRASARRSSRCTRASMPNARRADRATRRPVLAREHRWTGGPYGVGHAWT